MSFFTLSGFRPSHLSALKRIARTTGLEPATSTVTVVGLITPSTKYVTFINGQRTGRGVRENSSSPT